MEPQIKRKKTGQELLVEKKTAQGPVAVGMKTDQESVVGRRKTG